MKRWIWTTLAALVLSAGAVEAAEYSSSPYLNSYMRRYSTLPGLSGGNYRGGGYRPRRNFYSPYYRNYGYRSHGWDYGGLSYGFGHGAPYGYGYGYPYYLYNSGDQFGPYVLPPLYAPAEDMYGPQAVQRFMGLNNDVPVVRNNVIVARPAVEDPPQEARRSNAESRARSRRFQAIGDDYFAKQKFHIAMQRYRDASTAAPDLAEPQFRQGHALVALGQYEAAADAYSRGIKLDPLWVHAERPLEELYAGNRITKTSHLEALAQAANEQPNDPTLLFVLGVRLYVDGQQDRSEQFFERARALLAGEDDSHLEPFLAAPIEQPAGEIPEPRELPGVDS